MAVHLPQPAQSYKQAGTETKTWLKNCDVCATCSISQIFSLVLIALHREHAVGHLHVSCNQNKIFTDEAENVVHYSKSGELVDKRLVQE